MAEVITRTRTIEFSALDISAQPHPDGSYVGLFKKARALRRAIKINGQEFGELSTLAYEKNEAGEIESISGAIYRFTKIDEKADWFDVSTGEPASGDVLEDLSIPANLRPNTRVIHWVFFTAPHLLVFVRKNGKATLSPDQAAQYFGTLMGMASKTIEDIEYVDVTTVKSAEELERIFKKPVVSSLHIDLRRPNADGANPAMERILKTMETEGASRWQESLTAGKNGSLIKSDRIGELLDASKRLGSAQAVTYDDSGKKEDIDTKNHPMIEKQAYDPGTKVPLITFVAGVAVAIVAAILKKPK